MKYLLLFVAVFATGWILIARPFESRNADAFEPGEAIHVESTMIDDNQTKPRRLDPEVSPRKFVGEMKMESVEMIRKTPDDSPVESNVPVLRKNPRILKIIKPWWQKRAQEIQGEIAKVAKEGGNQKDIELLLAGFKKEVEAQYDAAAR